MARPVGRTRRPSGCRSPAAEPPPVPARAPLPRPGSLSSLASFLAVDGDEERSADRQSPAGGAKVAARWMSVYLTLLRSKPLIAATRDLKVWSKDGRVLRDRFRGVVRASTNCLT